MPKIISNTIGSHLQALQDLFQTQAKHIIIISPYLAPNLSELLNLFDFRNVSTIKLVTTLKPNDPEQLTKPLILKTFFEHFEDKCPKTKLELHIDNRLHGKIYIGSKDEKYEAIISSANFTKNGLCNNHEWGLQISSLDRIKHIIDDVFNSIEYRDVSFTQVKKLCAFAEHYAEENPEWQKTASIDSNILSDVYSSEDSSNTEPQYILKPIGHTQNPILVKDQEDFSELHQNLHFSKKKPKMLKKGDIIITIAVGANALLSYFKITGELQHVTEEEASTKQWLERWPWYIEGRNQAQSFSKQWWIHNLTSSSLILEFTDKFPGTPITNAGGFTLGTLNFGNDKVQITKEFGDFLIDKIKRAEQFI